MKAAGFSISFQGLWYIPYNSLRSKTIMGNEPHGLLESYVIYCLLKSDLLSAGLTYEPAIYFKGLCLL